MGTMKLIEDLVKLIMERFRQNGYAQGKKRRCGHLGETNVGKAIECCDLTLHIQIKPG